MSDSMYQDDGNIADIVVTALETEIQAEIDVVASILDIERAGHYRIRLLDNETGETEDIPYRYEPGYDEDLIRWYWAEGNGSCDCNRALEFYRKRGNPDPNRTCGYSRMSLLGIWRMDDGVQIAESEI